MTKRMGKFSLAAVALVAAVFVCSDASAWWGGCCGIAPRPLLGGCCFNTCAPVCDPCYTPCFSACSPCGGDFVLGYRPGPIRRLLFGPYRWYNAGYGYGYGGYNSWSDCGDSCCGGDTTIYDSAPTVTPAAPLKKSVAEPGPVAIRGQNPAPAETGARVYQTSYQKFQNSQNKENSGLLTIYVPLDAKVYVNDKLTSTEGSKRAFVSFGLEDGFEYEYHVRAEVVRDGKLYPETQTILLHAGENLSVSFPFKALNKFPYEADYGM